MGHPPATRPCPPASPARRSVASDGGVVDDVTGEVETEDVTWTSYSSKPAFASIISEGEYRKLASDYTTVYTVAAMGAGALLWFMYSKWRQAGDANAKVAAGGSSDSGKRKGKGKGAK